MNSFKPGERVASNMAGYYFGLPGTIQGKAQAQYDALRYAVKLDIGKVISLRFYDIKRLEEKDPER